VHCWGYNDHGQLGDGTHLVRTTATLVTGVADAALIRGGAHGTCAVGAAGGLSCWGLGGTSAFPLSGFEDAVDVAVSFRLVCVVRRSGMVACAGLPDATARDVAIRAPIITEIADISDAIGIAATARKVCILRTAGALACFDADAVRGLGDSAERNKKAEPLAATIKTTALDVISSVTQIAAAEDRFCATLRDGRAACWSDGTRGGPPAAIPVFISGVADATEVALSSLNACARLRGGSVLCWGSGLHGALGVRTPPGGETTTARVDGLTGAEHVAVGDKFSCAARTRGDVVCWGSARHGALGNGTAAESSVPVEVKGIWGATDVAVGWGFSCALNGPGQVSCWGQAELGEIPEIVPPHVVRAFEGVKRLSSEGQMLCAYDSQGLTGCLSAADIVFASDGRSPQLWAPRPLRGARVVRGSLRRGGVAVLKDGQVVFWQPAVDPRDDPKVTPIEGVSDAVDVAVAGLFACAVRRSGRVTCGDANADRGAEVVKAIDVPDLQDAVSIAGSGDSVLSELDILRRSGRVAILRPDLGSLEAREDLFARDVVALALEDATFKCALVLNGAVGCSGNNSLGELGNGTFESSPLYLDSRLPYRPGGTFGWVAVRAITDAVGVAAGHQHACARRRDGRVFCWGDNGSQQLGASLLPYSYRPNTVLGLDGTDATPGSSAAKGNVRP
jgi:alpha-tubulin suppressor-like RCC1 family protein